VLSVGRERSGLFEPAAEEYARRVARYAPCELVECRDEEDLLGRVRPRERLVLLDERGKELSSEDLARWLEKRTHEGVDLAFAVGGADGFSDAARGKCFFTWSLSRLTLAHRLARVAALEQIYRAFTILRGEPYHRG
jgi:23S rRNA (pseudouridine1915-N3)-methyltransferase